MKFVKKYFFSGVLIVGVLLMTAVAFGADSLTDPNVPATTDDVVKALMTLIGGVKGASTITAIVLATQFLLQFFKSSLANFAGKYRLVIVLFLGLIGTIIAMMAQGMPLMSATLSGATISAAQVLISQIYKQFIVKANEQPAQAPAA